MAEFSRRSSRTSMRSKPLGQLLVENGDVTSEQVNDALAAQEQQGGMLGGILINMGACGAEAIAHALAKQVQVTDVQCDDLNVPPEVTQLVTRDFCLREKLCPFERLEGMLCVVMGNPLNRKAISDVEAMSHLKVKAFKAVWPKVSGLIERSYSELQSAPEPEHLSLELEGEPVSPPSHTAAKAAPAPVAAVHSDDEPLTLDDDIIPPSEPAADDENAGMLADEVVQVPVESAVFQKPHIEPTITGLEELDSGNAEMVDMARRPSGRSTAKPAKTPLKEPRKAKVNVDLDTFDQSLSQETIDITRPDSDAMEEISIAGHEHPRQLKTGEVLAALKLVPDSYFYQGAGPKNVPRTDDLLDILEALPVAEVLAETIADYERSKSGESEGKDDDTVVRPAAGRFGSRVEYQRAPATPMAAVRLGEGEFQKSSLTLVEDPCGDWEWMVASPGPVTVDSFED